MPRSASFPNPADPLDAYAAAAVVTGTARPVPLVATRYTIRIQGGLATVATERCFRNAEAASIEATLTFPVPVHATLFGLQARIGERVLEARTQRRQAARETYEDALDRGRTAVLHEEVLRGVHQLSVGHVAPGQEVTVTSAWALPLTAAAGGAMLHIPVTVGEIYGRSPLADSDDLMHGAALQEAELEVLCTSGTPGLVGGVLRDGRARIRLDAPIRILVSSWQPQRLQGRAADGRLVTLEIDAAPTGLLPLDAAILVDRSGSMDSPAAGLAVCSDRGQAAPSRSKHQVLVAGLAEAAVHASSADHVDLWQFNQEAMPVLGATFEKAISQLDAPGGGTEIGGAIGRVLAQRPTRDILLITDGKSHALDIQAAARGGRRFHVILIGEDSLEANVGHLAALTGGQILVAAGLEAGEMVRQAFAAMRTAHALAPTIEGRPMAAEAVLGGMRIRAVWREAGTDEGDTSCRSAAVVAAALALPCMTESAAAALAEAEGIVCHLTSLVLVDEAGASHDGITAQHKVATMAPRGMVEMRFCLPMAPVSIDGPPPAGPSPLWRRATGLKALFKLAQPKRSRPLRSFLDDDFEAFDLRSAVAAVDWTTEPEALRRGDLSRLPGPVADRIRQAAALPAVTELAAALGVDPLVAVVGLLARAAASSDRSAARLARMILGGGTARFARAAMGRATDAALDAAAKAIGL